jgi:hypothetical protein
MHGALSEAASRCCCTALLHGTLLRLLRHTAVDSLHTPGSDDMGCMHAIGHTWRQRRMHTTTRLVAAVPAARRWRWCILAT